MSGVCGSRWGRLGAALALAGLLAACGSTGERKPMHPYPAPPVAVKGGAGKLPALPPAGSGRGAYYQDDGPGDAPPPDLWEVPDAEVRDEPLNPHANRPYVVFGTTYTPITDKSPFTQRGLGSWYGKKFHGQRTSSGELYDMYKMSAAHPTLPIPSYARVTNVATGASVVVRINDRGPFHPDRIIDLSYTAALKLGLLSSGSQVVDVERIIPGQTDLWANRRNADPPRLAVGPAPTETVSLHAGASAPEVAALMLDEQEPGAAAPAPTAGDVPPTVVVKAAAPIVPRAVNYYLQLGAFSTEARANEVRARLIKYGGVLAQLDVAQAGRFYRLFCGPFDTRADATAAEETLPVAVGLHPIIVKR